jgi:hypothetical protein
MRKDMFKVIVERPRWGSGARARNRAVDLDDEASARETTAHRDRDRFKSLNENLNPLKRWLEAQVGRPWDKVYAELCEGIDRRSTVQQHIHQHVEDFVAVRVVRVRGELWSGNGLRPMPLEQVRQRLYVDPDTGLLRANRAAIRARRAERAAWSMRRRRAGECPHPRRIVSATLQLHRLDGLWFAVEVRTIPPAPPQGSHWREAPFDVLRQCNAWQLPAWHDVDGQLANATLYGRHDAFAAGKRQLDRNELRRHGLQNL